MSGNRVGYNINTNAIVSSEIQSIATACWRTLCLAVNNNIIGVIENAWTGVIAQNFGKELNEKLVSWKNESLVQNLTRYCSEIETNLQAWISATHNEGKYTVTPPSVDSGDIDYYRIQESKDGKVYIQEETINSLDLKQVISNAVDWDTLLDSVASKIAFIGGDQEANAKAYGKLINSYLMSTTDSIVASFNAKKMEAINAYKAQSQQTFTQ